MEVLAGIRVGIEAGVWTVEDAERLGASGLGGRLTRILVEPGELRLQDSEDKAADAIGLVEDIHEALDGVGSDGAQRLSVASSSSRRSLCGLRIA
jgi:hypothetical protein